MSLESKTSHLQRLAFGVLIGVMLAAFVPTRVTHAQVSTPASYTFEECDQVKASDLRDELNRITQSVVAEGQSGLSISEIVERNWFALNLDATVDAAVEAATERVMKETGLGDRIISIWSREKAEEFTAKVAFYAFDSLDFRNAFDAFTFNISSDIVSEVKLMTEKSASTALLCVQTFLGDNISPTMANALEEQIQSRLLDIQEPDSDFSWLDMAVANSALLSGLGVVISAQIAKRLGKVLAGKISGQIVKRILGRLATGAIPIVGTLIGVALTVWDLVNARQGSLPMIRDALQDTEVKEEIRAQVSKHLEAELRFALPRLARSISNDIYSQWREFRREYSRVLELAEEYGRFRDILDNTAVEEVQKLAKFATLIEEEFGLEVLKKLIEEGHFERLLVIPEEFHLILEHVNDPQVAIDWADLAGELITKVIETELYRVALPGDFRDRAALERILALDSAELIRIIMVLEWDVRDSILGLHTDHVEQILISLTVDELSWLARVYLIELEPEDSNDLVDRILDQPEITPELKVDWVRTAILSFGDIRAVLNFVGQRIEEKLWPGKTLNMFSAVGPALLGELPMSLFWHYDGRILLSVLYVMAGLIALYVLWRRVKSTGRWALISLLRKLTAPKRRGSVESDTNVKSIDPRDDDKEDSL